MKKLVFLALIIVVVFAGQSPSNFPGATGTTMAVPEPVKITNRPIAVPGSFIPGENRQLAVIYDLNRDSNIRIEFSNFNRTVKAINVLAGEDGGRRGRNSVIWSAKGIGGGYELPGVYFVNIISPSDNRFLGRTEVFILD